MNKKAKLVASLNAQKKVKDAALANVNGLLAKSSISEDAKALAESRKQELQAEIDAIKALIEESEAVEEDKTEEFLAQLKELQEKQKDIENRVNGGGKAKNFIESNDTRKEFAKILNSVTNKAEMHKEWGAHLAKNGVTDPSIFLPTAIATEITDTFDKAADGFLNFVRVSRLKALKAVIETGADRAGQHKRGTAKVDQELTFVSKEIRTKYMCKFIKLYREDVELQEADALLDYVLRELPERTIHEAMRSMLIGDGRDAGDARKVTAIESIAREVSDLYVNVFNATGTDAQGNNAGSTVTIEDIAVAADSITSGNRKVMFTSPIVARQLRRYVAATGGTVQYKSLNEVADELGVAEIRVSDIFINQAAGETYAAAVIYDRDSYDMLIPHSEDLFRDFDSENNMYKYLLEVPMGGALTKAHSGAVIYVKNPEA